MKKYLTNFKDPDTEESVVLGDEVYHGYADDNGGPLNQFNIVFNEIYEVGSSLPNDVGYAGGNQVNYLYEVLGVLSE